MQFLESTLMSENTAPEDTGTPEANPIEDQARAQGWVPKDEWQGEGKWRDAEAFLDRGELFQKIDAQRREVRELRKTQESFNAHLKTVRDAEYKRALATVREEKKNALVDGDPDAVIRADDKLVALQIEAEKVAREERQAQVVSGDPHPDFQAWQAKNTWYSDSNRAMKAFADVEGVRLAQSGMPADQVLREIEAQVRKEFPEKFTNPNRSRPSAVEAGAGRGTSSKESVSLSDEERSVMNRLVKSGTLTKEQYLADLKAAKER